MQRLFHRIMQVLPPVSRIVESQSAADAARRDQQNVPPLLQKMVEFRNSIPGFPEFYESRKYQLFGRLTEVLSVQMHTTGTLERTG